MSYYIKSKKIFKENEILLDHALKIEGDQITAFVKNYELSSKDTVVDCGNKIIIPALIDLHIHGAVGKDVMDGDYESLNEISNYLASNGVGRFLAATLTAPIFKIENALKNIKESKKRGLAGAEIIGSYLEGPYLSKEKKGAHPEEYLRDPDISEIEKLINISGNNIKVLALAPEKNNSQKVIKFLRDKGIIAALAHTNANYSIIEESVKNGAFLATHTFNGMKGLHHRNPGALGGIMAFDEIYSELIADKIHVHPAVMKILYKVKGLEKIALISDCMRAGGLEDGEYILGEMDVNVKNATARTGSGSLAGSTLKIKDALLNIKEAVDIELFEAVKMASLVPAKILGLDSELGSIKKFKKADITVIDSEMNIYLTAVDGEIVYKNNLEGLN